jgi:dTDP-4-dehydrorhamnose reductase
VLWRRIPEALRLGTYLRHPQQGLVHLDIRDETATLRLVEEVRPAIIYMTAAEPSADVCEANPRECAAVTAGGAAAVARAAREVGATVVYFSTDYVFDGLAGPYSEEATTSPINEYGRVKVAAEEAVRSTSQRALIVRPSGVYGYEPRGKNFVMGLRARLLRGDTVRLPHDQIGTPTHVDDLVDAVLALVNADQSGIFHVAGPDAMDRFSFGRLIADVFGLDASRLTSASTVELAQSAPRPLRAGLRTEKLQQALGYALRGPEAGLLAMRALFETEGRTNTQ